MHDYASIAAMSTSTTTPYRPRIIDPVLAELLGELPAISILGPRASGKTTTALTAARTVLRLDKPAEAAAVAADPDAAIRSLPEPILLDEWQQTPTVLGAVKRAVDAEPRPGRFILTGSVRAALDTEAWPGTGRIVHLAMSALSLRERLGDAHAPTFIERVARSGADELGLPSQLPDLRDYVALALASGFPEPALRLSPPARTRWLRSYLEQMVTRDARLVEGGRDPTRLRRYFEVLALNTAGVCDAKTLYQSAGIARMTAEAYERLFAELFVLDAVPAWYSNRLKRLVKMPKRYLVDPGLAAAAVGLDEATVMRDHDQIGRLLDTLVAAELRAEIPACPTPVRLHHLRTEGARQEVDLLVELAGHRIIAIEVKAAAAVHVNDARHLVWLRDELGERFVHGLVLHTGPRRFTLSDRVSAVPLAALWA